MSGHLDYFPIFCYHAIPHDSVPGPVDAGFADWSAGLAWRLRSFRDAQRCRRALRLMRRSAFIGNYPAHPVHEILAEPHPLQTPRFQHEETGRQSRRSSEQPMGTAPRPFVTSSLLLRAENARRAPPQAQDVFATRSYPMSGERNAPTAPTGARRPSPQRGEGEFRAAPPHAW